MQTCPYWGQVSQRFDAHTSSVVVDGIEPEAGNEPRPWKRQLPVRSSIHSANVTRGGKVSTAFEIKRVPLTYPSGEIVGLIFGVT